jgi:hypothetical protein
MRGLVQKARSRVGSISVMSSMSVCPGSQPLSPCSATCWGCGGLGLEQGGTRMSTNSLALRIHAQRRPHSLQPPRVNHLFGYVLGPRVLAQRTAVTWDIPCFELEYKKSAVVASCWSCVGPGRRASTR